MKRTRYRLDGMDCSSEEQMVRMSLEPVERLAFDLFVRTVDVVHEGPRGPLLEAFSGSESQSGSVGVTKRLEHHPAVERPQSARPP